MGWLILMLGFLIMLAGIVGILVCVPAIRQRWVTAPLFKIYRRLLPIMSQTERDALEAGTVWWEGELFA
ncbi:MAG: hypothetical protein K2X64_03090, partial [Rhodocyclaceae bacterium]|nr:hypothetical protein [Rhodocyclaceae bacterium]